MQIKHILYLIKKYTEIVNVDKLDKLCTLPNNHLIINTTN